MGTDTPKDTPFKRWLLPDVVGRQYISIRLFFWPLPQLQINVHRESGSDYAHKTVLKIYWVAAVGAEGSALLSGKEPSYLGYRSNFA